MEVATNTPLPQRPQKNQQIQNKNLKKPIEAVDNGPSEKKPRFNQPGPNGAVGNQNKGGNQKGFVGNRRGGNANRGGQNQRNFQNPNQHIKNLQQNNQNQQNANQQNPNQQNQIQQPQNQPNQPNTNQAVDVKPQINNQETANPENRPPQQNQNQNRNRGGNRDRSRGQRGNAGGAGTGGNQGGGSGGRNDEFFISQRLRTITGPTHELPPLEVTAEAKFSGRNRLYVGNLTTDTTEEDLRELFKPYGEIGEVFSNPEKNFTFLKIDYHSNAEKAKRELDGSMRKGRALRVRFAPNATILRVRNLTPFVSNELLYKAFEIFGPVERASIVVDDRGKPTGEGVVEFEKKSSANACLRFCTDRCFFLTASLRPCVVEPLEVNDDNDGLPEKSLNKKTPEFHHERNVGPRFADLDSFEHEYGTRWKQLHELFKSKQEALKRELKMEEEKLEAQMEYARYEHETELLRQELRKRESDNERKKIEWEMREKQAEEMRKRDEENMRRQQNEMQSRMMRQEEEMRRRQQENTLFMQAQQLNTLLDQQEVGFNINGSNFDTFGAASNSPFEFRGNNTGGNCGPNNGPNNQQDAFAFEFGGNNQNQGGGQGNRGNNGGNSNNNGNPWERRRRF